MRMSVLCLLGSVALAAGCCHQSAMVASSFSDPYCNCVNPDSCTACPPVYDQRHPHRARDMRRWYRQLARDQRAYAFAGEGGYSGAYDSPDMYGMDSMSYDGGYCENGMCMNGGTMPGMTMDGGMAHEGGGFCPTCQQQLMQPSMMPSQAHPVPTPAPVPVPGAISDPLPEHHPASTPPGELQPHPAPPTTGMQRSPGGYFPPASWQPTMPHNHPESYPVQPYTPAAPVQQTLFAPGAY